MESTDLGTRTRQVAARATAGLSAALAGEGVTAAEAMLLRVLHDAGAVPPSDLAARMAMTRGAVTKLVDRLRAKRLIVRARAGRADRRYQTIALTGAGASLLPTLTDRAAAAEAAVFGHLSAADRATLARLLDAVLAADAMPPHDRFPEAQ